MGLADDKRSYERLFDVPGIKPKTARRILAGFLPMKDEIRELMSYVKLNKAESYKSTICFTKVRDHDFEAYLNTIGVGVTEALSKNTDLLVAGSMDSSKVTKATKWGIPIVTLDAAYKMYGYKP
jgi:NAD-dependent DNA ligase